MALKELLGDKYNAEMTVADAEKLLEGKRLADLSTGEYVSKAKYEADTKRLSELQAEVDGKQAEIDAAVAKAVKDAQDAAKADYDKQLETERTSDKRKRALEKAYEGLSDEQKDILSAFVKEDELKLSEDGTKFDNFDELAKPVREKFKTVFSKDDGTGGKGGLPPAGGDPAKKLDDYADYRKYR